MKAITLDEAKALLPGRILYEMYSHNADGTPCRWRVNGKVKTWKQDQSRVQVPVKHGLYDYAYLTENNRGFFSLGEE